MNVIGLLFVLAGLGFLAYETYSIVCDVIEKRKNKKDKGG